MKHIRHIMLHLIR